MSGEKGKISRQLLCNSLLALNIDIREYEKHSNSSLDQSIFSLPNQAAFNYITYFLFGKLDYAKRAERFRWPLHSKKDESEFRRAAFNWLTKLSQENVDARIPMFAMSLFITPSGDKLCLLYLSFARHVVQTVFFRKHCCGLILHVPLPTTLGTRNAAVSFRSAVFMNMVSEYRAIQYSSSSREQKIETCSNTFKNTNSLLKEENKSIQALLQETFKTITDKHRTLEDLERSCEALLKSNYLYWSQFQEIQQKVNSGKQVIDVVLDYSHKSCLDGDKYSVKAPLALINIIRSNLEELNLFRIQENGKLDLKNLMRFFNIVIPLLKKMVNNLSEELDINALIMQQKDLEKELVSITENTQKAENEDLKILSESLENQLNFVNCLDISKRPLLNGDEYKLQRATPDLSHVRSVVMNDSACCALMDVSPINWLDSSQSQQSDNTPSPDLRRRTLERTLSASKSPGNKIKCKSGKIPLKLKPSLNKGHKNGSNTTGTSKTNVMASSKEAKLSSEDNCLQSVNNGSKQVYEDHKSYDLPSGSPKSCVLGQSPNLLEDLLFSPLLNMSGSFSRKSLGSDMSFIDNQTLLDCPSFDISSELNASKLLFLDNIEDE